MGALELAASRFEDQQRVVVPGKARFSKSVGVTPINVWETAWPAWAATADRIEFWNLCSSPFSLVVTIQGPLPTEPSFSPTVTALTVMTVLSPRSYPQLRMRKHVMLIS